jgi:hypothetical protein
MQVICGRKIYVKEKSQIGHYILYMGTINSRETLLHMRQKCLCVNGEYTERIYACIHEEDAKKL